MLLLRPLESATEVEIVEDVVSWKSCLETLTSAGFAWLSIDREWLTEGLAVVLNNEMVDMP